MGQNGDPPTLLQRLLGPLADTGFWPRTALIGLIFLGLTAGSIILWHRVGHRVVTQPDLNISAERIHVTPQPAWIGRTDVKSEAIVSGGLDQLNLRQQDVTVRVAQAFSMHSWVAKVKRCSKSFPGTLTVEVDYRRPVAMVHVTDGWYPIDRQGVLLPPGDFTPEQTREFPYVFAEGAEPREPVGSVWGDARVHGGARVAELLAPVWKTLHLYAIRTEHVTNSKGTSRVNIDLFTDKDTRILWGSPPGDEAIGEASADTKMARLREFHAEHGSLDKVGPDRVIDLRPTDRLYVAAAIDKDQR